MAWSDTANWTTALREPGGCTALPLSVGFSSYSSVTVVFKSIPLPGWESKFAIPVSGTFKSVWSDPAQELCRKNLPVKTHTHFN